MPQVTSFDGMGSIDEPRIEITGGIFGDESNIYFFDRLISTRFELYRFSLDTKQIFRFDEGFIPNNPFSNAYTNADIKAIKVGNYFLLNAGARLYVIDITSNEIKRVLESNYSVSAFINYRDSVVFIAYVEQRHQLLKFDISQDTGNYSISPIRSSYQVRPAVFDDFIAAHDVLYFRGFSTDPDALTNGIYYIDSNFSVNKVEGIPQNESAVFPLVKSNGNVYTLAYGNPDESSLYSIGSSHRASKYMDLWPGSNDRADSLNATDSRLYFTRRGKGPVFAGSVRELHSADGDTSEIRDTGYFSYGSPYTTKDAVYTVGGPYSTNADGLRIDRLKGRNEKPKTLEGLSIEGEYHGSLGALTKTDNSFFSSDYSFYYWYNDNTENQQQLLTESGTPPTQFLGVIGNSVYFTGRDSSNRAQIYRVNTDGSSDVAGETLTAQFGHGSSVKQFFTGDPVSTSTGNFYLSLEDHSVLGVGEGLSLMRSYNSRSADEGVLGVGWRNNYELSLSVPDESSVVVTFGDGHNEYFEDDDADGVYTSRYEGNYNEIAALSDGRYELLLKDQRRFGFSAEGYLISQKDRNGNTITFSYNNDGELLTAVNPSGRSLSYTYNGEGRLASVSDSAGHTVSYGYSIAGDLISYTDVHGAVTQYDYDDAHRLIRVITPKGHTEIENVYDELNRVISQSNGRGQVTTMAYDTPVANSTTTMFAEGNTVTYYHDDRLRLVRKVDGLGHASEYAYDENNNRVRTIDRNGHNQTSTYDARGNMTSMTDARGQITQYTYNADDDMTSETDALGQQRQFQYDSAGNLITLIDAAGATAQWTYDERGLMLSATDRNGNGSSRSYDAMGNLVSLTNALGETTTFTHDDLGNRLSATDAVDDTATFTYDAQGRLLTSTTAGGNTTTYAYDVNGNLSTITDGLGRESTYGYDERENLVSVSDALGQETSYTYDANDRRLSQIDAKGNTTSYTYDTVDHLVNVSDAEGRSQRYTYDKEGNLISQINDAGETITYSYDENNNRLSSTNGRGDTRSVSYDALNRVISRTSADHTQTTSLSYDALGRVTMVMDATGLVTMIEYDSEGNPTRISDPKDNAREYTYDALNRVVSIKGALGSTDTYTYDSAGNLVAMTDANGETTWYEYDADDRVTKRDYPMDPDVTYRYDVVGNRAAMSDASGSHTYAYDELDRIIRLVQPLGHVVGYSYDETGNLKTLIYPGNKVVRYDYNDTNQLTEVMDWLGNATQYDYDNVGRVRRTLFPNGTGTSYEYNAASQLTFLEHTRATESDEPLPGYAVTLDANGNITRISAEHTLTPSVSALSESREHDAQNQLATINGEGAIYDNKGNLLKLKNNQHSFNTADRLTGAMHAGLDSTYVYDGDHRRRSKAQGGQTTHYTLDVRSPLSWVLTESNDAGLIERYYLYGDGLIGSIAADGATYYHHYDVTGSTTAISDSSGNTTARYAYTPFGDTTSTTTDDQPYRYLGKYGVEDDGNGLHYIRARYYDAQFSRFISEDVLDGQATSPQTLNKYVYALNSPVSKVDITGFSDQEVNPNQTESTDNLELLLKIARINEHSAAQTAADYSNVEVAYWDAAINFTSGVKYISGGLVVTLSGGIAAGAQGATVAAGASAKGIGIIYTGVGYGVDLSVALAKQVSGDAQGATKEVKKLLGKVVLGKVSTTVGDGFVKAAGGAKDLGAYGTAMIIGTYKSIGDVATFGFTKSIR